MPRGTFECTDMTTARTGSPPAPGADTSMTLATCDSIRELGHIDTADMRDKFVSWIARGEYTIDGVFDYGGDRPAPCTPAKEAPASATTATVRSAASLLAFTDATDEEISEVSAITHAHRTSTDACVIFVELLRNVMNDALPRGRCI
ncbi:MAG: ADP-ribosylglycohydrolase family protein [Collinsella sp.]